MTPEEFLRPRFKVIANWPQTAPRYEVGQVINGASARIANTEQSFPCKDYPHLFSEIPWHANRTMEEFATIRFVKFIKASYWRVGDVAKVRAFLWDTQSLETIKPRIIGFKLTYNNGMFTHVVPATEEEFIENQKDPNALKQ